MYMSKFTDENIESFLSLISGGTRHLHNLKFFVDWFINDEKNISLYLKSQFGEIDLYETQLLDFIYEIELLIDKNETTRAYELCETVLNVYFENRYD